MQVILRQDVEKLGLRGEVVDVAPGFARNYLLPRKLAETATPGKVAELRKHEEKRARQEAQSFDQAQEIVSRLESEEIRFDVPAGETGTLFGFRDGDRHRGEVWTDRRVRIDRRKIELAESIKRIGRYQVPVELFPDVTATLRLAIVPRRAASFRRRRSSRRSRPPRRRQRRRRQAQADAEHAQAEAVIQAVVEEETAEAEGERR
jgi:large subunit ribosomal protein L9